MITWGDWCKQARSWSKASYCVFRATCNACIMRLACADGGCHRSAERCEPKAFRSTKPPGFIFCEGHPLTLSRYQSMKESLRYTIAVEFAKL